MHIPFFRIFYSTTFTVLALVLIALLLITPIDQIYQAFRNEQIYNIFIIAGSHLLTLVIAVFVYASRIFSNRSALASIPRSWSPVEKGDVDKRVRRLVQEQLKRSAMIAYKAHPRDLQLELRATSPSSTYAHEDPNHLPLATREPVWGIISHPGWSSSSSPDLPSLHYDPVILELAHLIEAKAVSLAPTDPLFTPSESESPFPDALVIELLQRPATMGLREYISHLTSLGVLVPPNLGLSFLALYEKARFSGQPLDEMEFRTLMGIFAEMLRGMKELDASIATELHEKEDPMLMRMDGVFANDSESSSLKSSATVEHTRRPNMYDEEDIIFPPGPRTPDIPSSDISSPPSPQQTSERTSSSPTFASVRSRNGLHTPSFASFKQAVSNASSLRTRASSNSVIRLAQARTPLDLPYEFVIDKT